MTIGRMSSERIWKELVALLFPIMVVLLLGSGVSFIENILLARHSLAALNGSIQAICALQFFQMTCIVFANMTQIFVGEHLGAGEFSKVGNRVWQMIWISVLLMVVILPLGLIVMPLFFNSTEYQEISNRYFKILIPGNFLFPVGAALSAFFLAQGKRWVVIWSSVGAYSLNLLLDLMLIFGTASLIPPMGAQGAAWSGLLAKLLFCGLLFVRFMSKENQAHFQTNLWRVTLGSMGNCLRVCTPRAIGKAFTIFIGAATTYLMIYKGGLYVSIFSIGSSLLFFCRFWAESLVQSLTVLFARYLGAKDYFKLWKGWRFGLYMACAFGAVLAIPMLLFPQYILSFFFLEIPTGLEGECLKSAIYWVWFWVFINCVNVPFLAFILATQDTFYYMIVMSLTWASGWLPAYYCLYYLEWSPDKFWFVLIFDQLAVFLLNIWRVYTRCQPYRMVLVR